MIEISFDCIGQGDCPFTDDDIGKVIATFHVEHSNTGVTDDDIEVIKKAGIWRIRIPEKDYGKDNA
ncbi:unnamed protein product [marine sediment metagenome]|uniref:Uncharacterized protein n=1 Tax=marine sediment metagenome TaxID=412755 RepID=X1I506_9ZZZZ